METYPWGLLGQCFRSKWSFNYCNFTQSPSSPCWGLWYACQFYNLFIFLSWSNAVLSFVNDRYVIHKFFIFPFLVLTLQCMEYVWGPVSQITGSTAVRDVQMDGLWSHPSLLLLQSNNNEWINFIMYITRRNKHIIQQSDWFRWALIIDLQLRQICFKIDENYR